MGLRRLLRLLLLAAILAIALCSSAVKYKPTWASLDSRPTPDWYDEAKLGILVTYGLHSVPGFGPNFWKDLIESKKPELVQYMQENHPKGFTYQDFTKSFKAELYKPDDWARLFKESGARYVMLAGKESDGYTMFRSSFSPQWNVVDKGPGIDVMHDLSKAVRRHGLRFGMYYSLSEWNHPLFRKDKAADWKTGNFSKTKVIPELEEFVKNFKPDVLWVHSSDKGSDTYWNSKEFLAWLFNDSPVRDSVVVNDKWGGKDWCDHGGISTCYGNYMLEYQRMPRRKWELPVSLDKKSRGLRKNMNIKTDLLDLKTIVELIIKSISKGGNVLINVGAHSSGTIPLLFQERLRGLGKWLKTNGEAIYGTRSGDKGCKEGTQGITVYFAQKGNQTLYGMFTEWPETNLLYLDIVVSLLGKTEPLTVSMLGQGPLPFEYTNTGGNRLKVKLPQGSEAHGEVGWVVKFQSGVVSIPKPTSTTTKKPKTTTRPIVTTRPPRPPKPPTLPGILEVLPIPLPVDVPPPEPWETDFLWIAKILGLEEKGVITLPEWLRVILWIVLGIKPPPGSTYPLPEGVDPPKKWESLKEWVKYILAAAHRDQRVLPQWLINLILRVLHNKSETQVPLPIPPGVPATPPFGDLTKWAWKVFELYTEGRIVLPNWLLYYILQLLGISQPPIGSPGWTTPPPKPNAPQIIDLFPQPLPVGVPGPKPGQSPVDYAWYILGLEKNGAISLPDWLRVISWIILETKPPPGSTYPLPVGVPPPGDEESLQAWAQSILDAALRDQIVLPDWLRLLILRLLRITPLPGIPYPLPPDVPPPRPGQSLYEWAKKITKLISTGKIVPSFWLYDFIWKLLNLGPSDKPSTATPPALSDLPISIPPGVPTMRPGQPKREWALELYEAFLHGTIKLETGFVKVLLEILGFAPPQRPVVTPPIPRPTTEPTGSHFPSSLPAGVPTRKPDESEISWAWRVWLAFLKGALKLDAWLLKYIWKLLGFVR